MIDGLGEVRDESEKSKRKDDANSVVSRQNSTKQRHNLTLTCCGLISSCLSIMWRHFAGTFSPWLAIIVDCDCRSDSVVSLRR